MPPPLDIVPTDTADEATARVLLDGLNAHNTAAAGPHHDRPPTIAVRRPGAPAPVGGLVGYSFSGWLFIRLFHLPAELRLLLGTALLRRAQEEARARGCTGVFLDTFSVQARPFYERQGYRVFGSIEDHPPGHARHFLTKRLEGDAAGAGGSQHVPA